MLKALRSIYDCLKDDGIAVIEMRNYDRMLKDKPRFLPLRIHEEKDGQIVSVLYVLDYLQDRIRFNVVYLTKDKDTGAEEIDVEAVDYNPIRSSVFVDMLTRVGYMDIQVTEQGPNIQYTAVKQKTGKG